MSEKSIAVRANFRRPQTQIEEQAFELLREVRELFEQFRVEVPRKRSPWPESIKKRILVLWSLGVSSHQIGTEAGIPVMTLYSWRQRVNKANATGGFSEVPMVRGKRRTTFQRQMDEERRSSELQLSQLKSSPMTEVKPMTVVVIAPSGLRIEGVPIDAAVRIARELSE